MTGDLAGLVLAFERYIKDYNSHGGGFMRDKYDEDPMEGFDNVVSRFAPIARQARLLRALQSQEAGNEG